MTDETSSIQLKTTVRETLVTYEDLRQMGHMGADSPIEFLVKALRCLLRVEHEWSVISERDDLPVEVVKHFAHIMIKVAGLWSERAQTPRELVDAVGRPLSLPDSLDLREHVLLIMLKWIGVFDQSRIFLEESEDDVDVVEHDILELTARVHLRNAGGPIDPFSDGFDGDWSMHVANLVKRLGALQDVGKPIDSWSYSALARLELIADAADPVRAGKLLADAMRLNVGEPEDLAGVAIMAWHASVSKVPDAYIVERLNSVFRTSGSPFSYERVVLLSKIQSLWSLAVTGMLARGEVRNATELFRLMDYWTTGVGDRRSEPTLHLVGASDRVWGLLKTPAGAPPKVFEFTVRQHVQKQMLSASLAPDGTNITKARRDLAHVLRDVFLPPEIHQTVNLGLRPYGFLAWWPWMSVTLNGAPVAKAMKDLIWVRPTGEIFTSSQPKGNNSIPPLAPPSGGHVPDLLVLDMCFAESDLVRRQWLAVGLDEASIVEYDSRTSVLASDQIMARMSLSKNPWFFTHGVSDVLVAGRSGLQVSAEETISLESIHAAVSLDLRSAVLIACETGRINAFVSGQAIHEAIGFRSDAPIVSTLWSIRSNLGSRFIIEMLERVTSGLPVQTSWRDLVGKDHATYSAFICTTP